MNRRLLRRVVVQDALTLLDRLSLLQHFHPRGAVGTIAADACRDSGLAADAVVRALAHLEISAGSSVGRLRRTELVQLSRAIVRMARPSSALTASGAV